MDSLTPLEYHTLLAVTDEPLHGYSIRDRIEADSRGRLNPGAGTLYRLLARLVARGLLDLSQTEPGSDDPHPGLPRKYYGLTPAGRDALMEEARSLRAAYSLAARRLSLGESSP